MHSVRRWWVAVVLVVSVFGAGQAFGLIEAQEGPVLSTDAYLWGLSPDGRYAAGGSEGSRAVVIYDAVTGGLEGIAKLPEDVEAEDVEVSADGDRVVVGGEGPGVYCYDRSGALVWSRPDILGESSVAVTPPGDQVYASGYLLTGQDVLYWLDGATGADLMSPAPVDTRGWAIWGVETEASGDLVLVMTNSDVILMAGGMEVYFYDIVPGNSLFDAALSPDGTHFAVTYRDPATSLSYVALYETGVGETWEKELDSVYGGVEVDVHNWVFVSTERGTTLYNTAGTEITHWGDGSRRIGVAADGNRCVVPEIGGGEATVYDMVDVYECYPDLHMQAYLTAVEEHAPGMKQYTMEITNWETVPPELFVPSPELPRCGLNHQASRTYIDILGSEGTVYFSGCGASDGMSSEFLKRFMFRVPDSKPLDPYMYMELWDRKCDVRMRSNYVSTAHVCPVGDLNGDCVVNLLDLAWMAENWLVDGNP